jgi:hypothetical protein
VARVDAADADETDDDSHGRTEERERSVALSPPPSAAPCLFDECLLLTQPLDRRTVVEMVSTRGARRKANSHAAPLSA